MLLLEGEEAEKGREMVAVRDARQAPTMQEKRERKVKKPPTATAAPHPLLVLARAAAAAVAAVPNGPVGSIMNRLALARQQHRLPGESEEASSTGWR